MKHSFIDQYSDRDSLIHRLDPRTKFLATLLFILAVTLTPPGRWSAFAVYFLLIAILVLLSRVPLLYILKRSLVIIPFVLLIAVFVPFFKEGEVGRFPCGVSLSKGKFEWIKECAFSPFKKQGESCKLQAIHVF